MGSPGSPAYAICICMYYEYKFYNSIYDAQKLTPFLPHNTLIIRAKRYIDDVLAFIVHDKTQPHTHAITKLFISVLKCAYHSNMTLKEEPVVDNKTRFLETCISVYDDNNIDIAHHNKNFSHYSQHSEMKKLSIIDAHSFSPHTQPRNNILNTLHRIKQNCTNPLKIMTSTFEFMTLAVAHNYTRAHFNYALNRMGQTTGKPIWKIIKRVSNIWLAKHHNRLHMRLL